VPRRSAQHASPQCPYGSDWKPRTCDRSGPEAFLVPEVHGLPEKIGAVLVRLTVVAATVVAIDRSRVEVRIAIVVGVTVILQKHLLLMQVIQILLLKTVLRHPLLLL
jgi:hypothetical protein